MWFAPNCVCLLVFPFSSEIWPVAWRVSGMDSWKGMVLSSGGLRGWGFMAGGDLAQDIYMSNRLELPRGVQGTQKCIQNQ